MCSLQYSAPRLLGGQAALSTSRSFHPNVKLVLRANFRVSGFGGLRTSSSPCFFARRVPPLRRKLRSRIVRAVSEDKDLVNGSTAGEVEDASEVAVAGRKFSNLNEYGKSSSGSSENSSPVEVASVSESQNGGSQGSPELPRNPWSLGALLAVVWDRLMRNSLVAFITSWPAWQKRRKLERLLTEADANPQDAEKQAALLAELSKQRSDHFS